ncbi:MAG: hypothetical protein H7039_03155 [Bryobacteraceae bacterium]|nr:hypothetical protein [Bryobacteraceae bacterium]
MKKLIATMCLLAASAAAQNLTPQQKETDFRYLANLFATYYAPLEWKKEFLQVDGLAIRPWLARVAATTTDLDFYDICVDYVAQFQDTHASFQLPSDFVARLGFGVDIYDGKVLIETVNRTLLPLARYPFVVGDELVSIDGVPVEQLLSQFAKYGVQGNPRATMRITAARLVTRPQGLMPYASMLGESASVLIRRQSGADETYTIRWTKTGVPLEVGPVPSPKLAGAAPRAAVPSYEAELENLRFSGVTGAQLEYGLLNYGARNPVFVNGLTSFAFTRRLGGGASDFFYSGTFRHDNLTFGFLRIPNYSPPSQPLALQQLDAEIAYFQANTDGLIIDQMRNTGGFLCFGESIMTRLSPTPFQATGFALRAEWFRVIGFYNSVINAKASGAAPEVIEQLEKLYQAVREAYRTNRGVTAPVPICTSNLLRDTARDAAGQSIAYTKPILMLIDEFSTSTGDSVPGMFQENRRGVLYGYRTNAAGGTNTGFSAGPYSEGFTGMTIGLQVRNTPVLRDGYPYTGILENVGVHPEVVNDYMTRDNLLNNGAPFIQQFLWGTAAYVRQQRGEQ